MTVAPTSRVRGSISMVCFLAVLLLVVVLAAPSAGVAFQETPPATQVAPGPARHGVRPSADAQVMQSDPTENHGHDQTLVADLEPRSEVFLRFDVTEVTGQVTRATLRLWVTNATADAPALWTSPNTTWAESEVTWNTRPAVDAEVSNQAEAPADAWLEYDVTSVVAGDGSYTFALIAEDTDGLDVASRESDANQPELVIEQGGEAQAGDPVGDGENILLAAGDIARCDNDGDERTAAILDNQPGTIAVLGDNAYNNGSSEEYANCYDPSWGRYKDRTRPVPGNHEYQTEGAVGYFDYFATAAGDPDKGYYSYDVGTWHVIALNSNIDMSENSEQLGWLRDDLEQHPVACTVAYWHHPRFSSGGEHRNNRDVIPLYRTLHASGADIVLNGHEHDYERFAPQTADGVADPDFGIRQFVVGTGGTYLRELGEIQPNSEVQNADTPGVLRLTLGSDSYSWTFLSVDGKTFTDSGTGTCHGAPASNIGDGMPVGYLQSDRPLALVTGRHR